MTTLTLEALPASTPAAPLADLTIDQVRKAWQSATWDRIDEEGVAHAVSGRHSLEVASLIPASQHPEFYQITSRMILTQELCSMGVCTNPECPSVAALGRTDHVFALTDDLFRVARLRGNAA